MQPLIAKLKDRCPTLRFTAGSQFCWSPETAEVIYDAQATGHKAEWSLLHETGHGLLEHTTYNADFQLLRLEVAAWQEAVALGKELGVAIDEDHIQDCLDTYRDWLYRRSICPQCHTKCLQQDSGDYHCFNCHAVWKVSDSRFNRSYRRAITQPAVVFQLKK